MVVPPLNFVPAIIVSCLASFRQFFMKQAQARYTSTMDRSHSTVYRQLLSFRAKLSLPKPTPSTFRGVFSRRARHRPTLSTASKDRIIPLETIYVSHHVGISNDSLKAPDGHLQSIGYGNTNQIHSGSIMQPPKLATR